MHLTNGLVVADSLLVIRETKKAANAVCWARILRMQEGAPW